ncbi:MAG: hypothetical protein AAF399_27105, partial [Bacteroidota bacterium]
GLANGMYRLVVDGVAGEPMYWLGEAAPRDLLGMIELWVHPDLSPGDYGMVEAVDEGTALRPKTYVARIKNRATRWYYHYREDHELAPATLSANGFEWIDERAIVTALPAGLLADPPPFEPDGNQAVPSPEPGRIRAEYDSNQLVSNLFSDIYL